jgi:signal transduction histidine kinase
MAQTLSPRRDRKEVALDLNFFVVLSHELSQPISAASASLSLLLDRIGPLSELSEQEIAELKRTLSGKDAAKLLEIAIRNLDQLQSLLDSLRLYGQAETGTLQIEVQPEPVEQMLTDAIENFGTPGSGTTIRYECEPGLEARVSLTLFRQVLSNLIANAAKFSPAGSVVSLDAREHDDDEVVISVSDQGGGFPAQEAERIFGKYVRLQPGEKGLGVGLFVAKAIVEAHGGHIWAENINRGARFSVAVPAA